MSIGPNDTTCLICGAHYWSMSGHVCPMLDTPESVIARHLAALAAQWPSTTWRDLGNAGTLVCVPDVKLRDGAWNRHSATIWFVIPLGYPICPPNTFWSQQLWFAHGGEPSYTTWWDAPLWAPETREGQPVWQRFYCRLEAWSPNRGDDLRTFVRTCQQWLDARLPQPEGADHG